MFSRASLLAALLGLAGSTLFAAELATYDFTTGSLGPSAALDGVTAGGFYDGGSSKAVVGSGSDSGKYAYILIKKESRNANAAVSNGQYAQLTVQFSSPVQLDQLQFTAGRGGRSTPRGVAVRWSLDNYGSNLAIVDVSKQWPSRQTYTVRTKSYVGESVTFRLYAFADQVGQVEPSVRFSNLKLIGGFIVTPPVTQPTVAPYNTRLTTSRNQKPIRGSAYASAGIASVEVAAGSRNAEYKPAKGTTSWNYKATGLKKGNNVYYVRAVDFDGNLSTPVKVVVKRRN